MTATPDRTALREALEVLHADAVDPQRAAMWRYGVQHTLSIVEAVIGPDQMVAPFDPPAPDDTQRRCWTLHAAPDGTSQCRLFNGHDGDHDVGIFEPMTTIDRAALREAATQTLTPWHGSPVGEPTTFLRRCIDIQCLGDSPIVNDTAEAVEVKHRPGCAVAEFFRRLDAATPAPEADSLNLRDDLPPGWAAAYTKVVRVQKGYEVDGVGAVLCATCRHPHDEGSWSDTDPNDGTCWSTAGPLVCGCPKFIAPHMLVIQRVLRAIAIDARLAAQPEPSAPEGLDVAVVTAAYRAWVTCGETGWAHNGGEPCVIAQHAAAYREATR